MTQTLGFFSTSPSSSMKDENSNSVGDEDNIACVNDDFVCSMFVEDDVFVFTPIEAFDTLLPNAQMFLDGRLKVGVMNDMEVVIVFVPAAVLVEG
mmetsp:Transcript_19129/g.24114  ORF Transcript_19129/g.24114 Transcript_19129/m.24114 type:complete len:95 (-) Transcript_19129:133-417(-)